MENEIVAAFHVQLGHEASRDIFSRRRIQLHARIVRVADHDLRLARRLLIGVRLEDGRGRHMLDAHLAEVSRGFLRVLQGRGRTSPGGFDEGAGHVQLSVLGLDDGAKVGERVESDPRRKDARTRAGGGPECECADDGSRIVVDDEGQRLHPRRDLAEDMDADRNQSRILGLFGRFDRERRIVLGDRAIGEQISADHDPGIVVGTRRCGEQDGR